MASSCFVSVTVTLVPSSLSRARRRAWRIRASSRCRSFIIFLPVMVTRDCHDELKRALPLRGRSAVLRFEPVPVSPRLRGRRPLMPPAFGLRAPLDKKTGTRPVCFISVKVSLSRRLLRRPRWCSQL
uniref:Uncharacterized protein n=1 Tax=Escherichia coli TaxID=562 RepID=A0A385EMX6_ECOLX|nr:hypothetical protein pECSIC9_00024 [Escherichia coli]